MPSRPLTGADAAQELGLSVAAVYVAKLRVWTAPPPGGGGTHLSSPSPGELEAAIEEDATGCSCVKY